MPEKTPKKAEKSAVVRPPVVVVMGHIDHGKSTLLDYIRKTAIVETEAGGITQRISAYEVVHAAKDGKEHRITFLDTPGHEAFSAMRARGATVADIAILVVAADDGVKPQTIEALKTIQQAKIPFIVAINKTDKEGADIDWTKASLAESEIYVEGYGGTIPFAAVSAKTGQGVSDLLDLVTLAAELEELQGDPTGPAEGVIIEANLDKRRGIAATIVVKNGTIKTGSFVQAGPAYAPIRIMENFIGKALKEATFSSPIQIIGWNELPPVGSTISIFDSKREAEGAAANAQSQGKVRQTAEAISDLAIVPIVIKARDAGGLEAVTHEIKKIKNDKLLIRVIQSGVGDITEGDIKIGSGRADTVILGFSVGVDAQAKAQSEKLAIPIFTFDIIYKLSEWLAEEIAKRTPKEMVEETAGVAKIVRIFSKTKDRQIVGGRVESGELKVGGEIKIMRRDFEVGKGRVRELQRQKNKVSDVPEGQEFGAMIESKMEIAAGDRLEAFTVVEK